jgi:hypothetical protein
MRGGVDSESEASDNIPRGKGNSLSFAISIGGILDVV